MNELGLRGKEFEEAILDTARIYWAKRVAYLQRFHVPKIVRNGHTIYTAKTGYDFVGSHFDGNGMARSLYIEAKDIDSNTLPILEPVVKGQKKQSHGAKFHQLITLAELQKQNAECWVLWRKGTHVFRLEPQFLLMTVKPGNSLGFLDVPTESVVNCSQGIDFLNAL